MISIGSSLVGVLEFSEFTNMFHVSFLSFLKSLCLMALLYWDDLSLDVLVGSLRCLVYSSLTIFSSLSHSLFHHAAVGLPFVSEDVLGMVLSAACSMVWLAKLCASSIMFWFCTFVFIVLSFWYCFQFSLPMLHFCYFMKTFLSSSMMMEKWWLPQSSYFLAHSRWGLSLG